MAAAALAVGDDLGFHEHEERWQDVLHRHGLAWFAATHGLWIAFVEISVGKAAQPSGGSGMRGSSSRRSARSGGSSWSTNSCARRSERRIGRASSSGSPMRSRRPSRSPIGVPSSDANCCSRGRTCSVGPRSKRRPPQGARSSSWSPPTTSPTTPTRCSCSLTFSTCAIWESTPPRRDAAIAKLQAKGNLAAVARLRA